MKAVILGAGYGTRLEADLRNDDNQQFSHLIGLPKPLLPIGPLGDPLITHWVEALKKCSHFDEIIVVTNSTNHHQFEEWRKTYPDVQLVCDGSTSNETRKGAVAAMKIGADAEMNSGDTLVIGGSPCILCVSRDTLFYDDFSLGEVVQEFLSFKSRDPRASMVLYVTCTDEEVHKYGILETNDERRVIGFLEKPQPTETESRKECPCFYIFNQSSLHRLGEFLEEKKDQPMKSRDATGNFVAYLQERTPVYTYEISGRFDVGGLESYLVCHGYFLEKHGSIDFS